MNIGQITRRANGNNGSVLVGRIDTLAINMTIALRLLNNPKPTAPKYEIMAKTRANSWVRVGALFEQEARTTGEIFYQGQIEDPSMERPLSIALFRANTDDGSEVYNIAWTRRRARQNLSDAPQQSGDLGESTAGQGEGRDGEGEGSGFPWDRLGREGENPSSETKPAGRGRRKASEQAGDFGDGF